MHIPDGFLSPVTYIPAVVVAAPLLVYSYKKTRDTLNEENFTLLSSLTAFSFIIMMFNIPIPGGTSGHAIGTAILAIIFGPWVAAFSVSIALFIQAIIFGDGGITAFGVNTLSMGFVAAFSASFAYKLLHNRVKENIALFFSGWIGIVLASLLVAIALGIQPMFGVDGKGNPIYFPFSMQVTIPALVGAHALFFGIAEGIATILVVSFVRKIGLIRNEKQNIQDNLEMAQ